jgi:uncharacterized SAM-binding protein YcdF (DUF218 family)
MSQVDKLGCIIWDYLCMREPVAPADVILVLGSHDLRVAGRAAELYQQGMAPLMVFSGGFGRLTGDFEKPEAEIFAEIAIRAGVPESALLIENESANTGQNIEFSQKLLQARGLHPQRYILVTKPYMERRAVATFKRILPAKDVTPTSPLIDFKHYPHDEFSKEEVTHIMVGDLQRIIVYPARGFQIPMEIPAEVWKAFEQLVALGYTKHLV